MTVAFASVVLDVDSTLCGIEGIDWLAGRAGDAIASEVSSQTDRAMRGELRLEDVYARRLDAVRPGQSDLDELGSAYVDSLAPGAAEIIAAWHERGIKVVLVSGGIRQSILPVARRLGVQPEDVHAVTVNVDAAGSYAGFDTMSRLTVATGKRDVVATLELPRNVFAVGDGITDLAMREVVDMFCAFTGFATRTAVTSEADATASTFEELDQIIQAGRPRARRPLSTGPG